MEDWLFRESDDDPDRSEESEPSIETIVAAFRKALSQQRTQKEEEQGPSSEPRRSEVEADRGESESDDAGRGTEGDEPEPSRSSKGDVIEDTIAAFRKAKRRTSQAEDEPEARDERPRPREPESTAGPEASEREGQSPEEEEEAEIEGSIENFALAFRRALEQEGSGEGGADESETEDTEEAGHEQASRMPPEPDVEPTRRPGDGMPPSEEVEVSEGTPSGSSEESSVWSDRPDASFLWVTEQADDDPSSISVDRLTEPRAREADAFLLKGGGARPYELLTNIRGHSEMKVYLKPVFWGHAAGEESKVAEHVDGEWTRGDRSTLSTLREQAASINRRISNMVGSGARDESGMELRILRFMATRNHDFDPRRTAENSDGFVYPKLTPMIERGSRSAGGELVQILSILEDRRLLTGEFVMRQHACQNCGSGFLNFEETCPYCGSTDLDTDDLVHHFRCAFTGPLNEFKEKEGRLVCPKCDRSLKQIGVDYDKPSMVHTCRRCHEQFQDPEVQTTCYRCDRTNPPEQQIERHIKKYEVTALGEETAVYGMSDSLLSILERESRVLDYATFELIVKSEAARIERYQRSASSLLLVRVTGLRQLRTDLGQRSQEVVEEIATAFDNTLRSSDYLSARDESLYLFLLTETDEQGARRAGERLEENIEGVLRTNLERPPQLNIAVQPLRPGMDLDNVAEQFLASRTREPVSADAR